MLRQEFVHLHLHTEYSLLDGANRVSPLIESAKKFGMPALAITDHGNLFGAIEFYQKAKNGGVKPIIGCEAYLAPRSRFDKEGHGANADDYDTAVASNPYYHLILLAANQTGYKNLMKLVSIANLEGFYYKPRIDKEVLERHAEGLIGLSGCLRGEIPYLLARDLQKEAYAAADDYQRIFGKEHFFIEVQDNGLDLQVKVNRQLVELADKKGIPLVATNDCHYLHKEDAHAHDIMLCLQTGKTFNMPNRMRFETKELYLKSGEEMAAAFSELPQAVTNTVRIADMIDLDLSFGKAHMPDYRPPAGMSREAYLESLSAKGLARRFEQLKSPAHLRPVYESRLRQELDIINRMGYPGYFLIVWDIINYARQSRIPVGPGRGSAAGSLVAYALGITDIDPIGNGLIFERFLNPERVSLPDIDMDFCMDRRDEVIRYVNDKYGSDHVCQIITFGTMAAKGALRDVGRVLEVPYAEVDRLAKLVPNTLNITLDEALAQEPKFEEEKKNNPKVGELIDMAKQLEGLSRHASTHAAGVVISDAPLTEHVPLYRGSKGETVTQYPMGDIEKIGLIKFDFLGLRTLTVIDLALKMLNKKRETQGEPLLFALDFPLNDPSTYTLLGSGETTGIFQLESPGMRDLLIKMRPETFEDITAILALYRPGPIGSGMVDDFIKRKQGKKKIAYDHPKLEEILKETYGVIVYQEQVMKIANALAGFSLGEADLLRRAMGKKKADEMAAQKTLFIERAAAREISAKKAEKIFDLMEYFAGYGFNKSHSAAYALVTFQTAYLKTHYPAQFMAALLSCEMGNADKVVNYITECRRMGIDILPPDVNESDKGFTVVPGGIRFGLAAIKNVGGGAVDSILDVREKSGAFSSLYDFCRKIDLRKTNKRVIEALIKCGAFDGTKAKRAALMQVMDQAMQLGAQHKKEAESGQLSIFGGASAVCDPPAEPALPEIREWDDSQIARLEKEAIGFYITTHPLTRFESMLKERSVTPTDALSEITDDREVRVCGMVIQKRVATTKRGDRMAYLRIEDLVGSVEVIVFPELYRSGASLIDEEVPLMINGTLDHGDKGIKLKATLILPLEKKTKMTIHLSSEQVSPSDISHLNAILEESPGKIPVFLKIRVPDGDRFATEATIAVATRLNVDGSDRLKLELENRFGKGSVLSETC
ncbi:MAG: DNA polymerase III subunit alpha [Nitrospiria bacterium]